MAVERNLAQGMSREQAHRKAFLDFGGLQQARLIYPERRGLPFLDALLQDLRFAFRTLRNSPGFSAFAFFTFALCLGRRTAIFSLLQRALLPCLRVPGP